MIARRLREAPEHVQDVFAAARAALQAYEVTGEFTADGAAAVVAALELRHELGDD